MKIKGNMSQAVTAQMNTKNATFLNLGEANKERPGIDQAYPSPSARSMTMAGRLDKKDGEGKNKQHGVSQDEGKVGPAAEAPEAAAGRVDAPGESQGDKPDEPDEQERNEQGARASEETDDEKHAAQDLHPGQYDGDEERQGVWNDLVVLDALGKTEGVADLQRSGPDKDSPDENPEEKEQPPVSDHGDFSSGRPAALQSAQPPAKIRIS